MATIVLREEPYLLVHFLEYHNIYLLATDEGSTALIGTFSNLDNNQIEELPPQVFHNNSQLVVL